MNTHASPRVNSPRPPTSCFPPFSKGRQGGFSDFGSTMPAINHPHFPLKNREGYPAIRPHSINPDRIPS